MAPPISFRSLSRADFPMVSEWLARPHVHRWWNDDPSLEHLEDEYGDGIDGDEEFHSFIALRASTPFGFVQLYPIHADDEYVAEFDSVYPVDDRAWSIDYFIADRDLVGQGVGRRMIRQFVELVWEQYSQATSLVVPVNSANFASWKMLVGAGFDVVAEGEMEPDNPIDGRAHHILRLDRPD